MSNTVDEIIAQARAAASAPVQTTSAALVEAGLAPAPAQVAPAGEYGGGSKSLEELAAGAGASVDVYLKAKYAGIYLGDDVTPFEELKVRVRGSEILSYTAISWGNPAKYARTANGRTESYSGKQWSRVVEDALAQGSKGPYDAADLPLYSVDEIKSLKKPNVGKVLVEAGGVIGFTTSKSAMKEVKTFIRNVVLKLGQDELLEGTVKLKPLKNESGEWGVLDFGGLADWKIVDEGE